MRALARGVDGEYGKFASLPEHVESEYIDRRGFSGTRNACDTDTSGVAGIRQAFFYDLLCELLVGVGCRFDESDGLSEDGDGTLDDAFDVVGCREFRTARTRATVGVDTGL